MESLFLPKMVHIPSGSFLMGSEDGYNDEQPVHEVTISDFYLAETPITFEQYDYFCEQTGREKPNDTDWGRDSRPVINVSWYEAQAYCRWLSEQTNDTYRLPTEAEWEYAAGGSSVDRTKFAGTDSEDSLGSYAVYNNFISGTNPVKNKRPNRLGLYDMSGNVWEWCNDWYDSDYYASSPSSNPKGPTSGATRVFRGGGWFVNAGNCRVASRYNGSPNFCYSGLGFRVAR